MEPRSCLLLKIKFTLLLTPDDQDRTDILFDYFYSSGHTSCVINSQAKQTDEAKSSSSISFCLSIIFLLLEFHFRFLLPIWHVNIINLIFLLLHLIMITKHVHTEHFQSWILSIGIFSNWKIFFMLIKKTHLLIVNITTSRLFQSFLKGVHLRTSFPACSRWKLTGTGWHLWVLTRGNVDVLTIFWRWPWGRRR